jgi:hypothetical protein
MTRDELKQMVGELIEEKWVELLGDSDEGLEVGEAVRRRL